MSSVSNVLRSKSVKYRPQSVTFIGADEAGDEFSHGAGHLAAAV